jgi:hypothetical protein
MLKKVPHRTIRRAAEFLLFANSADSLSALGVAGLPSRSTTRSMTLHQPGRSTEDLATGHSARCRFSKA